MPLLFSENIGLGVRTLGLSKPAIVRLTTNQMTVIFCNGVPVALVTYNCVIFERLVPVVSASNKTMSGPKGPKTLLEGSSLAQILEENRQYVLGWDTVDILATQPGSQMRRPRPTGIKMWEEKFEGVGWCQDFFARVYIDHDDEEKYDEFVKDTKAANKRAKRSGEKLTHCGRHVDISGDGLHIYIVDGRHRIEALKKKLAAAMERFKCDADDERVAQYRYFKAIIYEKAVKANMTMLSKAANDQVNVCVPEDNHEKMTFIVAMAEEYEAALDAGTVEGKLNQTNLVEFYLQKTGMVKLKNKDGVREYKAINYHKMTCGAALNMRGPILEYLKTLLERHEEAGNKVILIFFFVLFNVFFW